MTPSGRTAQYRCALVAAMVSIAVTVGAQENTGQIQQPLVNGALVSPESQELDGLLTLSTGCSASLLRNNWVITAAHCVDNPNAAGEFVTVPENSVTVTANWTATQMQQSMRIITFRPADVAIIRVGSPFRVGGTVVGFNRAILRNANLPGLPIIAFGRGINVFAQGAGATATPSQRDGRYRAADFTIQDVDGGRYGFPSTGGRSIAGGDSGGPSFTTVGGAHLLVGVHSLCAATCVQGQMCGDWAGTGPPPAGYQPWQWVAATPSCSDAAVDPVWDDIDRFLGVSTIPTPLTLMQIQDDGAIWRYTGTPCAGEACPGWTAIDRNSRSAGISGVYQRHVDGKIWAWDGDSPCVAGACPGWMLIDMNPRTKDIVAARDTVFQRHVDGAIWSWDRRTPCTSTACPGWTLIDRNPNTIAIAGGVSMLIQRHADGRLWKWAGDTRCDAAGCPGWMLIDMNPRTTDMVVARGTVFQRHGDGSIWSWDGKTPCAGTACPGWTLIDRNANTVAITGGAGGFYQRHADGRIWSWDGHTPCSANACPGWTLIDMNPRTKDIVAGGKALFQRHADGSIWSWDGHTPCSGAACPGWSLVDRNPHTKAIAAIDKM